MATLPTHLETPSGRVELRSRRPADQAAVERIYRSTREPELDLTGWDETQKADFARMQLFAQDTDFRERFRGLEELVVERDGAAIGRLAVHRGLGEVVLVEIAVLADHRGAGVGTAAVRAVTALADAIGVPTRLTVEDGNPARRLYERLGFEPGAALPGPIRRSTMERPCPPTPT